MIHWDSLDVKKQRVYARIYEDQDRGSYNLKSQFLEALKPRDVSKQNFWARKLHRVCPVVSSDVSSRRWLSLVNGARNRNSRWKKSWRFLAFRNKRFVRGVLFSKGEVIEKDERHRWGKARN